MAGEIKISNLPEILSGSYDESGVIPTVINGTTYKIDIENLRPILLKYYNLTSESFDSSSYIQIPVSSQIYSEIISQTSSLYNTVTNDINALTTSIYISSSQEVDNDIYKDILVTTSTDQILLKLSGNVDENHVNISKIDSANGYVRISSSYNETILDDAYFDLYYQYETLNLKYNSGSSNYIQI